MDLETPKKRSYPRERMIFAFDCKGDAHLLFGKGPAIESDIDAVGLSPDDLGLDGFPDQADAPDSGIWIYECLPEADVQGGEFDHMDYQVREPAWRKPTLQERAWILEGEYEALGESWGDVPSLEEFSDDWRPKCQES